ncbi:helix-turn-helix domain-containing protein [Spirosoma sp. HMF4905]|uniref:Helix-turn-helix domain-containing protein n=1 Tax=Spirosoma arboris TaxID=2682092 RepID=A0A7K1SIP1_9BACT|nr:helix-turn-helix domain-containing protein [Spirosoma arboris]MVM33643.1 helix-turn-helix domain-containing protein [Spirosoma arboris]
MNAYSIGVEAREAIRKIIEARDISVRSLSAMIEIAEQSVSSMLSGGRTLTDKTLAKMSKALDVPFEIVKYGEGLEPYLKGKPSQEEARAIGLIDETEVVTSKSGMEFRDLDNGMVLMTMTLVPEYAYASYPHGWRDPEYLIELPKYSIVLPAPEPGFFRAFEVRGDSMDDGTKYAIGHGDVAVGKKIDPDMWNYKLYQNGGTDYIVVTHDGVICKRIIDQDIKEGVIICASKNPNKNEYPNFTIRLSEVYELYKIRKIDRDWNHR